MSQHGTRGEINIDIISSTDEVTIASGPLAG